MVEGWIIVQPGVVRPWFVRSAEYVGAGPALAWDSPLTLQPNQELTLSLTALLLDRPLDLAEAAALSRRLASPL